MLTNILTCIIFIIILYLIWRWYINWYLNGLEDLKGPPIYPFIGSILELFPVSKAMIKLGEMCSVYGKSYKMAIPFAVGLITADADFVEFIMTSHDTINKSILYIFLKDWLGDGLLLSKFGKWRSRRKMITPTFHFKILEQFLTVFNKNNTILVQQLQRDVKKDEGNVNVAHFITLAAMDNIVETAMGTSIDCQLNDQSEYVSSTKFMTANIYNHIVNPVTYLRPTYIFTSAFWKERKALQVLKNFTMSLIKSKREALLNEHQKETSVNIDNEDYGIKKKTAFLDLLLQCTVDGVPLSDQDIMEEVDTFMFEGHDTVSAGLSFTLYCIAQHPDIQGKIIDEQRSIFGGDPEKDTTSEDLKQMVYLEMVIKEGLRLYPSVPSIARIVTKDFTYKNLKVRKGMNLMIPISYIHKDPEHFPQPEEFIPERFLPEEQAKRHPFVYLPFSAGHRNCIGQKFAMMELKSTISRVCRRFVLSMTNPPHECYVPSAIVLNSENGVYINMQARKW